MTTYEKIKKFGGVAILMSNMYAGGRSGTDEKGIKIAKEYELRALSMIKELRNEEMSPENKLLFSQAFNHFKYFRQLKYRAYVAENRESQAFDCVYSQTAHEAEKELKAKIGEEEKDLFFWTVYVHENGEEEKL